MFIMQILQVSSMFHGDKSLKYSQEATVVPGAERWLNTLVSLL